MALLKSYNLNTEFPNGLTPSVLTEQIIAASVITGFEIVDFGGENLDVYGGTLDNPGGLDTVIANHVAEPDLPFSSADSVKLGGIQSGATLNDTDANLHSRSLATGTQVASTVSDFDASVSANSDVVSNTAKVGITPTQASDITSNNAKLSFEIADQSETDTGTNDSKGITPLKLKNWEHLSQDTVYAYNMGATAGTFNGLSAIASAGAILYGRWYFKTFPDGNPNPNKVTYFNRTLPTNYKAGSDITFKIHITNSTTSGDVRWHLGMTQPTGTDDYGDSADTEWVVNNVAVPTAGVFRKQIHTVTFSGTGLVAGDELSFIMMRESTNAGDTNSGTAYINMADIDISVKG